MPLRKKERRVFPAKKTKTSSNVKVITFSDSDRENKKSVHENNENEIIWTKKSESKKKKIIISVIIISLFIALTLAIYFTIARKKGTDENETKEEMNDNGEDSKANEENKDDTKIIEKPIIISKDEAMKIFEPIFKVASK